MKALVFVEVEIILGGSQVILDAKPSQEPTILVNHLGSHWTGLTKHCMYRRVEKVLEYSA